LGGVLAIVLIIAMNLWVNLALVLGTLCAAVRYMGKSPSDHKRAEAPTRTEVTPTFTGEGQMFRGFRQLRTATAQVSYK